MSAVAGGPAVEIRRGPAAVGWMVEAVGGGGPTWDLGGNGVISSSLSSCSPYLEKCFTCNNNTWLKIQQLQF